MRVEIGEPLGMGQRARRNLGGRFEFTVPKFGAACACCDADAAGRTRTYDPSADRTHAASFPIPVCEACDDHALRSPAVAGWQSGLLVSGVGAIVGAFVLRDGHPGDAIGIAAIALGAAMLVCGLGWKVLGALRARGMRARGHHAVTVTVTRGVTTISTTNEALAQRLLAKHKDARLLGATIPRARAR